MRAEGGEVIGVTGVRYAADLKRLHGRGFEQSRIGAGSQTKPARRLDELRRPRAAAAPPDRYRQVSADSDN
jgi:hypothetical protein